MLASRKPLSNYPGDTHEEREALRSKFSGLSYACASAAIRAKHPCIAFERSHALRALRVESDTIIAAILALLKRDVIALPLHDGLITAASCSRLAMVEMVTAAMERTGTVIEAVPSN
jgi:hypothetical protein